MPEVDPATRRTSPKSIRTTTQGADQTGPLHQEAGNTVVSHPISAAC